MLLGLHSYQRFLGLFSIRPWLAAFNTTTVPVVTREVLRELGGSEDSGCMPKADGYPLQSRELHVDDSGQASAKHRCAELSNQVHTSVPVLRRARHGSSSAGPGECAICELPRFLSLAT